MAAELDHRVAAFRPDFHTFAARVSDTAFHQAKGDVLAAELGWGVGVIDGDGVRSNLPERHFGLVVAAQVDDVAAMAGRVLALDGWQNFVHGTGLRDRRVPAAVRGT